MSESDQKLLQACRKGDTRAWERLLKKYERLVYSIPLNYGLSDEDAADIAQLAFTILLQRLDTLREDTRLGPWLATVARRHTWRLLHRRQREDTLAAEDLSEAAVLLGKPGDDPIEKWELIEWLDHGLSLIGERCRELLLALYFDAQQPSYAEIAERLNMPLGSVGPTRARCLQRLREVLRIE